MSYPYITGVWGLALVACDRACVCVCAGAHAHTHTYTQCLDGTDA